MLLFHVQLAKGNINDARYVSVSSVGVFLLEKSGLMKLYVIPVYNEAKKA